LSHTFAALAHLKGVRSFVIDGELVACNNAGMPDFLRKVRLEKLILAANVGWLHPSESFDDGIELLKAADRMKLEGIVSKRREAAPFAYGCTFGPSGIGGGRPSFYAAKRISSVPGMFSSSEVEVLHPT
jgi:hypothetical protein